MVGAQLLDATADGVADAETTKQPVVGVSAAMVNGTTVATVVIAVPAWWCGRPLCCVLRLMRAGRCVVRRHFNGTGRLVVEVRCLGVAPRNVLWLRHTGRVLARVITLRNVDGSGRLGATSQDSRGDGVGHFASVFLVCGVTGTG